MWGHSSSDVTLIDGHLCCLPSLQSYFLVFFFYYQSSVSSVLSCQQGFYFYFCMLHVMFLFVLDKDNSMSALYVDWSNYFALLCPKKK